MGCQWFAFHPHQRDLLQSHEETFVALGCGSPETILLIPGRTFVAWLERCNKTERDGKSCWHFKVKKNTEGYLLDVKKGAGVIRLNEFLLKL